EGLLVSACGGVECGQHFSLSHEQFIMVIPTAIIDEKRLPSKTKLAADFNGSHHGLERRGEISFRKQSVHRCAQARIGRVELLLDKLLRAIARFGKLREALDQEIGVMLFQSAAQSRV